jgi:galactokinase/mevalonate kinase-like predicted kinase
MLLYYTGITRVAKTILAEIVEGMFLNSKQHMEILQEMKIHAKNLSENIQGLNFNELCRSVAYSWELNNRLDSGTTNPEIQKIISAIHDLAAGYKLAGAGGGGFLFILARDPLAALKIRKTLEESPPNERARFVDMQLSYNGFQVSKS